MPRTEEQWGFEIDNKQSKIYKEVEYKFLDHKLSQEKMCLGHANI